MIYLKTDDEIELLRRANLLVGDTLAEVAKLIRPGVTTRQLDTVAETFIRDHGAEPTFKGFPNPYGPDCGVKLDGFCGDSCYTFAVGEISAEVRTLLQVTKESLYKGIEQAIAGKRLGDIGYAVQTHCEAQGYGVVREFVGHGIGHEMHEDPQVPNYGKRGSGKLLKNGLCIAIEPMITLGSPQIALLDNRWSVITQDRKPAAHFEHTIAIHHGKADILSSFDKIEAIENK